MIERIRAFVERMVPWYDPIRADREHRALRVELAASRAIRKRADETMRNGYGAYAERMRARR